MKTSLNRRMKYIVFAVVILLLAVSYPLYNHYHDLQVTLQQQNDLLATKFAMQQPNDDLQATLQQQNDSLQAIVQQQNDDLQATKSVQHDLRETQNDDLRATLQQQNDSLQATVQQQKADGHVQHLQHDNLQTIIHNSMTFELTDYRKKMDNNVRYFSPSFYTSPNGYNMKIRVYANGYGEGEGTHVSVDTCVVKGKYDDDLNWPFVGDITFKLLEDKKDHSQFSIITSEKNLRTQSCLRDPQFYSIHSLLHDSNSTTQYLKNDTLYFRISVQASGHRPWSTDMEKKIVEVNERSHVMTFKLPESSKR